MKHQWSLIYTLLSLFQFAYIAGDERCLEHLVRLRRNAIQIRYTDKVFRRSELAKNIPMIDLLLQISGQTGDNGLFSGNKLPTGHVVNVGIVKFATGGCSARVELCMLKGIGLPKPQNWFFVCSQHIESALSGRTVTDDKVDTSRRQFNPPLP